MKEQMKRTVWISLCLAGMLAAGTGYAQRRDAGTAVAGTVTTPQAYRGSKQYDSYKGLVMAGYQGWFNAPGDGAQILLYPVISMNPALTHAGSRHNLLGDNPSAELEKELSNDLQVDKKTPAAFIALSDDDLVVKPENSRLYYEALRSHHIPAELKTYPTGGHGWGSNLNFEYHPEVFMALKDWLGNL